MTPTYRTRSRAELCPFHQEPSVNARIITANAEVIKNHYGTLQPASVTEFPGEMTITGYKLDLAVNQFNGRVVANEIDARNSSLVHVILGVTLVREEKGKKEGDMSVFCEIQDVNEGMSTRAAANFNVAVQLAKFHC